MFIHTHRAHTRKDFTPYYVAAFTLQKGMYEPVSEWCYQTFGEPGDGEDLDRWEDQIWYGEIWFRDEQDLMMFKLRWS